MPSQTFAVAPAGDGAGGDVSFYTDISQTIALPFTGNRLDSRVTTHKSGGIDSWGLMVRFEISAAIPAGATITGARFTFFDSGSINVPSSQHRMGIVADDGIWSNANGFADSGYVNSADLPRAVTPSHDDTVFVDSNAYSINIDTSGYSLHDTWQLGTGSLSGDLDVTGLLADIQTSFDDTTEAIVLQIAANTGLPRAGTRFSDGFTDSGAYAPSLELVWTPVNLAPVVSITTPAAPVSANHLAPVSFAGTSTDPEDGDISAALRWTSSLMGPFHYYLGASFSTTVLSVGVHVITATSTDSGGLVGTDTIGVTIVETVPTVTISAPAAPVSTNHLASVTFLATATDALGADLASGIVWSSSLDGDVHTGAGFSTSVLSLGVHVITATATDGESVEGTDTIGVTIVLVRPVVEITSPLIPNVFSERLPVLFTATAFDALGVDISSVIVWGSYPLGVSGTGAVFSLDSLAPGSYTFTINATDSEGWGSGAGASLIIVANPLQGSADLAATASATSTLKASPSINSETSAEGSADASVGASATVNAETRGSQT